MEKDSGVRVETHLIDAQMLRKLMERKGIGCRQMAREAGTSPATISRLTTGKATYTRGDVAKAIAKSLDMPEDILFRTEVFYVSRNYARRNAA